MSSKGYHQYFVTFPPATWSWRFAWVRPRRGVSSQERGAIGLRRHGFEVNFITIMQNFSSNVAVMGKIMNPLIMPANSQFSQGGVVMSQGYLHVFFRSEQGTGVEASVVVEAPLLRSLFGPQRRFEGHAKPACYTFVLLERVHFRSRETWIFVL